VETIRIFRRDDVLGNVRRRGEQIAWALNQLRDHPWVRDVRGLGLMWGIELADPRDSRPAGELASEIQTAALRRGLILELGGRHNCVVRMLPPLNVPEELVDTACGIFWRPSRSAAHRLRGHLGR
jgi:diaminobutyrate-2-oxoglutarate transaminase